MSSSTFQDSLYESMLLKGNM